MYSKAPLSQWLVSAAPLLGVCVAPLVHSHGYLTEPPSRAYECQLENSQADWQETMAILNRCGSAALYEPPINFL